jgi:hypothetical protein
VSGFDVKYALFYKKTSSLTKKIHALKHPRKYESNKKEKHTTEDRQPHGDTICLILALGCFLLSFLTLFCYLIAHYFFDWDDDDDAAAFFSSFTPSCFATGKGGAFTIPAKTRFRECRVTGPHL